MPRFAAGLWRGPAQTGAGATGIEERVGLEAILQFFPLLSQSHIGCGLTGPQYAARSCSVTVRGGSRLGQPERALKLNHELYERTADVPPWRALAGVVYLMLGDTRRAERICGDLQCSGGNGDGFVCSYLLAQLGEVDR